MQDLLNWLSANQTWMFGGIGTAVVVAILGWMLRPRSKPGDGPGPGSTIETSDKIETRGDYSPGKVGGDYTVNDKR